MFADRILLYAATVAALVGLASPARAQHTPPPARVGCFTDPGASDLQRLVASGSSTMTPTVCAAMCSDAGFAYAGVQNGQSCYCGGIFGVNGAPSSTCNVPCSGDPSTICGGPAANSVYIAQPSLARLGCYKDSPTNPDLPVQAASGDTSMTVEKCRGECAALGQAYSGVQNGDSCYCGNTFGSHGTSTNCTSMCAGNVLETCGGAKANEVYATWPEGPIAGAKGIVHEGVYFATYRDILYRITGALTCLTTAEPQTLLDNGTTRLTWDSYGNLTLVNYGAATPSNPNVTKAVWGLGARHPLTGSTEQGQLCFQGNGQLIITDHAGNVAFHTPVGNTIANYLALDDCTLRMGGVANGANQVTWTEQTPECNTRTLLPSATTRIWPTIMSAPANENVQRILWDADTGTELDWVNGHLLLYNANGTFYSNDQTVSEWGSNQGAYANQANGELRITTFGSVTVSELQPGLHGEGVNDKWTTYGSPWGQDNAYQLDLRPCSVTLDMNLFGAMFTGYVIGNQNAGLLMCSAPSSTDTAACRLATAGGAILSAPGRGTLWWSTNGLQVRDPHGNVVSQLSPPSSTAILCENPDLNVRDDGNTTFDAAAQGNASLFASNVVLQMLTDAAGNAAAALVRPDLEAQCNTGSPTCDAQGLNCSFPPPAPSGCSSSTYYTVWESSPLQTTQTLPSGGFSYVKDMAKGNSDFGAELWVLAAAENYNGIASVNQAASSYANVANDLAADQPASPTPGYAGVLAAVGSSITLFGSSTTLLDINVNAENDTSGATSNLTVTCPLGTIYQGSPALSAPVDRPATFLSADATYVLGIVPVTVTASVTGDLGITYTPGASSWGASWTESPYVTVDADASVSVGPNQKLSAGIEGSLNLLSLSVPVTIGVTYGSSRSYGEQITFQASTLSGEIDLYGEASPFKATKTIATFTGETYSTQLFDVTGSF